MRSDGLPGRALATIDAWCRAGEVAATSQGLSLVPPHDPSQNGTEQSTLLVRAMEQTGARDQHVLHLVAVLDRPVGPALLMPLLRGPGLAPADGVVPDDVASVVASLDRLVDLQLLASTPDGYAVRDPFLRHAVESWLRPSVRRRLHAHIAERARIPAAEPGRSRLAALERSSAYRCSHRRRARRDGGRRRLRRPSAAARRQRPRGRLTRPSGADLAELEESLADVCLAAGRVDEAVQHYGRAADWLDDSCVAHRRAVARQGGSRPELAGPGGPRDAQPEAPTPHRPPDESQPYDEAREREARAAVLAGRHLRAAAQRVEARSRLVREHLLPSRRSRGPAR